MPDRYVPKVALARQMRRALTSAEYLLWERLKRRENDGIAFRCQHPKGPFILDFYCAKVKLCVEVDGALHDAERDERRDKWLKEKRIEVYRIPASEVYRNPDDAADGVWLIVEDRMRNGFK